LSSGQASTWHVERLGFFCERVHQNNKDAWHARNALEMPVKLQTKPPLIHSKLRRNDFLPLEMKINTRVFSQPAEKLKCNFIGRILAQRLQHSLTFSIISDAPFI
jgi:hypothetical protein